MTNLVIDARNISKVYGLAPNETFALRDVSLAVKRGEYVAIIGPSGSGKSTLMNILGCLDKPTHGEYYFDGRWVSTLSENALSQIRNKDIGFVFQSFNLLPRTSSIRNVELPLIYSGISSSQRYERSRNMLERLGLADKLNSTPAKLSGGQQQRVAIARALINDPVVIFADEPTGNLDTKASGEIMKIFEELNEKEKATIIMITHEKEIAEHAKRIIRILDGQIVSDTNSHKRNLTDGMKSKG